MVSKRRHVSMLNVDLQIVRPNDHYCSANFANMALVKACVFSGP